MTVDVHTWIGAYPFRDVPHPEPEVLVRVLEREELSGAWVGHLPSAFWRDPSSGNDSLYAAVDRWSTILRPIPCIRPDWPEWERALAGAVDRGVSAIRAYPPQWGLGPQDDAMRELAAACGEAGVAILLTTRFEDARQRHWMDTAGDVSGAAIRALARASDRVQVVVCAAGRALIEEVHWGLTSSERSRVWWDISWVWGPPEDDLSHLVRTCGAERFVYGTGWPLRLMQTPRANLALLADDVRDARLATAEDITRSAELAAAR